MERGEVQAQTTCEVLQELAHVRARRRTRRDAAWFATACAALSAPVLVVDADDLRAGLVLFERASSWGAFDCVLAATAQRRSAAGLVSPDAASSRVRRLRHLDPGDPGFSSAVRAPS